MAKHVPLPSSKKALPPKSAAKPDIPRNALNQRVALVVDEGEHVYVVRVKIKTGGLGGFIFLTHRNKIKQQQLAEMTTEAARICNEVRIPERRKEMAAAKTPCEDPVRINEVWFEGDVDFVEGVMCDKYEFRKLLHVTAAGEIDPTIVSGL